MLLNHNGERTLQVGCWRVFIGIINIIVIIIIIIIIIIIFYCN